MWGGNVGHPQILRRSIWSDRDFSIPKCEFCGCPELPNFVMGVPNFAVTTFLFRKPNFVLLFPTAETDQERT